MISKLLGLTVFLGLLCMGVCTLVADEVKLKTGEVLQGKILSQDEKNLTLDHPILGRLIIPMAQITSPAATPVLATVPASAPAATLPKTTVIPTTQPTENSFIDNWKAKLELGISGATGNSDLFTGHAGFLASKETPYDRWKFDTAYNKSESNGKETQENFTASVLKDWLFPESKWLWWTDGRYDFDKFKSWDHRASGHTGPGYEFFKQPDFSLIGRAGIGAVKEWGSKNKAVRPEGLASIEFTWKIDDRQTLAGGSTIYPSLEDATDFRTLSKLNWTTKLDAVQGLSLKFGLEHEYESKVDPGRKHHDIRYLATLVLDF